jgi:protein-S-isoprenylcysteine O-methyltransferase Ste14
MSSGWNALIENLPELATARGLLRASLMIFVPVIIVLGALWFIREVSAFLALVLQIAVYALAHRLLSDFYSPGNRPYSEAYFGRLLPAVGLHIASLAFILFSSVPDAAAERIVPPLIGIPVALYLVITGSAILARAWRAAGIATLSGMFVYFPNDSEPVGSSVYAIVRHPVYAGMARIALGFAALNGAAFAWVLALLFVFVYQSRWIDLEEREMAARFGDRYRPGDRPAMFPSSSAGEVDLLRRAFVGKPASAEVTSA